MDISAIVREDVVTVYMDDTLLDVAEVLRLEGVGSAVVLDPHDEVLGIVTDRDLVVYGQEFAESLEQTTVNQVLSMAVFSVSPDTSLLDLTEQMRESGVRRVPIMDNGDLLGIVTLDDIVVHLATQLDSPELQNLAAVIESESPSRDPD
ncbi:MAG: CBS domain-containing protein [Haloarculaceae archaeon]